MGRSKCLGLLKCSFDKHLNYLGPVSCFYPEFPLCTLLGAAGTEGVVVGSMFTEMAGSIFGPKPKKVTKPHGGIIENSSGRYPGRGEQDQWDWEG